MLTNAIKTAVAFFSKIGDKNFELNLFPICPPIKTAIKSIDVKYQFTVNFGFEI